MNVSRRELLIAAGASTVVLGGCGRVASAVREISLTQRTPPQIGDDPFVNLLNRFAFGPTAAEVETLRAVGADHWFESQLSPDSDEPIELAMMVSRLEIEHLSAWELRDFKKEAVMSELRQKAILQATYSPWQLRERMVDFWTNHFSIYANKSLAAYRKPMDERLVVRKHALGNFANMVKASAESTAMLVYLDQQSSSAAHPNENYARELMELHTLGVHGGYSQKDVMEVARCFTGWTEERGFLKAKGKFTFDPALHDDGQKVVLGHTIPAGGGIKDGYRVLEILSRHPATAAHISSKLCRYFLGEDQPDAEKAMTAEFLRTGGDIKSVMRVLHREAKPSKPRVKRPFDFAIGAMRAIGAEIDGGDGVQDRLRRMGQALYTWPMPDGYPMSDEAWTGSVMARWQFACDLTANQIGGTSVNLDRQMKLRQTRDPVALASHLPASSLPRLESLTSKLKPSEAVALVLASPEYQWQ